MSAPSERPSYLVFVGAGFEFAGCVLIAIYLGHLVDQRFGFENQWGAVFGGILGFALGMYNFIRLARKLNR